ncbi:HNH endonuclease [Pseudomonas aeruginosa]|uniref:HNH endonuclease n=1 Tax=Pseudomonas aeruginosa TaxID=287 RepID=UPI002155DB1E|nr:HNH endonuclease [Pseudomonas aeruginosa]
MRDTERSVEYGVYGAHTETHHIEWLANGGEDTVENTVALCPNCHRKMHVVNDESDRIFLRMKVRLVLEHLGKEVQ